MPAQPQMTITIDAPPTPLIRAVPSTQTNTVFPVGTLATLENDSDKAIVGLSAVWVITDDSGKTHNDILISDSFALTRYQPVVAAHSSSHIGVSHVAPLGTATAGVGRSALSTDHIRSANLTLDAVLFEDGELWGPDKTHFAADLAARKAAATQLAQAARTALANHQSLAAAFAASPGLADTLNASMTPEALVMRNLMQRHIAFYSSQLRGRESNPPMLQGYIQFLEGLPAPPTIIRK